MGREQELATGLITGMVALREVSPKQKMSPEDFAEAMEQPDQKQLVTAFMGLVDDSVQSPQLAGIVIITLVHHMVNALNVLAEKEGLPLGTTARVFIEMVLEKVNEVSEIHQPKPNKEEQ